MKDIQDRIIELQKEINSLPQGSITTKKINNSIYYYLRQSINGKRKETYIDKDSALIIKVQIEKRKELEKELKELKLYLPKESYIKSPDIEYSVFNTYVSINEDLRRYIDKVKDYKKRNCFKTIKSYLKDEKTEKVLILYGLRRTGKTTLIRQAILDMNDSDFNRTAFIQIKSSDTLSDLNHDLKRLASLNYKYIFIDEVTLMKDFIEGSALFSDIFVASGMRIILSGTDSLGFMFTQDEQLFDRCLMVHTTFIPFKEFNYVLGINDVDEYIRYGGTMSLSGIDYNDSIFSSTKQTNEYIDSAIAKNIQHSLTNYQNANHFRALKDLYEKDELTSVINRVIEDMNHRFLISTLTRSFESNDLAISRKNLRNDKNRPNDILDNIDIDEVNLKLKKALDILNKEEQSIDINNDHVIEIKEYLKLLDLIVDVNIRHIPNSNTNNYLTIITQPGMRYVQALSLVDSLLKDKTFNKLSLKEKNYITERIKNEIKGRMLEELVLLETMFSNPNKDVFKLQFAIGEFDMVVCDKEKGSCKIYEIKHSKEVIKDQYRHLIDKEKCLKVEHQYGTIEGKYVLYKGESKIIDNINYLNIEEYLNNLN